MTSPTTPRSPAGRRPLSVWELPKLATLVHTYRKSKPKKPKLRPHFTPILAFVYRNRLAVCDQIRRRFPDSLPSARTARRHLAEMESLGLLDVQTVTNVSPLMPKPYFVTRTGLRHLQEAYARRGHDWQPAVSDRRRGAGQSFQHVFHELATTEFLLSVWETAQNRPDLELPMMERRSLVRHPAFQLPRCAKAQFLQPDGLFLFRQDSAGMMCCLVEIDTGTESEEKLARKFESYERWAASDLGQEYLRGLYRQHGAKNPGDAFRLLFVVCGNAQADCEKRLTTLLRLAEDLPSPLQRRLWLTTADRLTSQENCSTRLTIPIWFRPAISTSTIPDLSSASQPSFGSPLFPPEHEARATSTAS